MTKLISIDQIPKLANEDFFALYATNKLNSLDIPAREYFERQALIAHEVTIRFGERENDITSAYMMRTNRIEDVTGNYRSHLLMYIENEGEVMQFHVCSGADEAQLQVKMFKERGAIEIPDFATRSTQKIFPQAVGYCKLEEIHRITGHDIVSFTPKNP